VVAALATVLREQPGPNPGFLQECDWEAPCHVTTIGKKEAWKCKMQNEERRMKTGF